MSTQREKAERFQELHHGYAPLLLPNPWDQGTAKVFAALGFVALATTSSGHAAALGRLDGSVTRDEALAHVASIVEATGLPVSADLENGFADEPADVAANVGLAAAAGVAGCSVEDHTGRGDNPIYPAGLAAERVVAAAETAHGGPVRLVLTARAENYLHRRRDLDDTIARLQSFQAAGADVLYAPGLSDIDDIRQVVASVDLPVNVLAFPGGPSVSELTAVGVKRVSVGGAFNLVALGAVANAAREFMHDGTFGWWGLAGTGLEIAHTAFTR